MSDKQKELKGLLKEAMAEELEEKLAAFEERQAKKLEEMDTETKARLEAIEKMPARQVNVQAPGSENTVKLYKRFDLNKQGVRLQIADEAQREKIAKWFIDCITGKVAMNETTGAQGGYLVPEEYADVILSFARVASYALQKATIFPMSREIMNVPAEDGAVSVSITDEANEATESEPTVTQVQLTAKRIDAYSIFSSELMEDSAYDIVSWLTELFAEKIGEKIDAECIYGTSLGTGIETETGVNEVALDYGEGIANMTYTDLSNVVNQLTGNKLGGAEWVVPKAFTHYARLLQDGAGAYAWGSMKASDPPGIFGYPVAVVDQFPTDTGDNILAVFGNWKHVLLGRRKSDMTLDLDPYGRFTYYQLRSRMITRWAMAIGLPAGLVRLMSGAATTTTT